MVAVHGHGMHPLVLVVAAAAAAAAADEMVEKLLLSNGGSLHRLSFISTQEE